MSIQLQKLRMSKMISQWSPEIGFGKLMNSYRIWGLGYMLIICMALNI